MVRLTPDFSPDDGSNPVIEPKDIIEVNHMIGIIIGVAILTAAAAILARRAVQFHKTKGQSACANCPYSGRCSGGCGR